MAEDYKPAFLAAFSSGMLSERIQAARRLLKSCILCPRKCNVDRLNGKTGLCRTGSRAVVASCTPHFGEEDPLVGCGGSGTIFFSHCGLLCRFCQNFDISHEGHGAEVSARQLAEMMLHLQGRGCHNINFVTPSHVVPQILAAVQEAIPAGLKIPLVYNTSGYDRVQTLELLDGIVDIYMPDFKFWDPVVAATACDAPDYPAVARRAITEMHRQVGDLVLDRAGIARRGLLVRHLVLPDGAAGTREIMHFIARRVSSRTYVNLMAQYRPCGRALEFEILARGLTDQEFQAALETAQAEGLTRLDRRKRVFLLRPLGT